MCDDKYTDDELELINFMKLHMKNEDEVEKPTHTSWGNILKGRYYIKDEELKRFLTLYNHAIKNNSSIFFSILETQKEYSPIIVDIDLKKNLNDINKKERLYDNKMIILLIKTYFDIFDKYLTYEKEQIKVYLFEKEKYSIKDNIVKDGFHILFVDIKLNKKERLFIREKVIEQMQYMNVFENFIEDINNIIDKSVVSSNGWFLYGSKKPDGLLYDLSKVYDHKIKEIKTINITNRCKYFSIRYENDDKESTINYFTDKKILEKNNIPYKAENIDMDDELYVDLHNYIDMLDEERAKNYEDWRNVGLALHNTSDKLYDLWIDFSKNGGKKFNEESCKKFWNSFKNKYHNDCLTYKSIIYWAKIDNFDDYIKYINKKSSEYVNKSISTFYNTSDIAKVFKNNYLNRYICSSIEKNKWWEFINHKWIEIEEGYTIIMELSENFCNIYRKELLRNITKTMNNSLDQIEKEKLDKQKLNLDKIIVKLSNISSKIEIARELKYHLFDSGFDNKINSKEFLFGFNNGVYDLEKCKFRDGMPEDYIRFNCKHNYNKYNENLPHIKEIKKFFEEIFPIEVVKNYFLKILASSLLGINKDEKFFILTGSGSNGKSLLMELLKIAFGDYYMSCPIQLITRKRGKSNEACPEKIRMHGKRIGVFQETDDGEKINTGIMKELTGGDTIIGRDLYQNASKMLEFKPQMKYFLTCNQLPVIPSNDDGTWRRIVVINFISKFKTEPNLNNKYEFKTDPRLKTKINSWGTSLISYLIHIYEQNIDERFIIEPNEVKISTNKYKYINDYYKLFIKDKVEETNMETTDKIHSDILYDIFNIWMKSNRYDKKINSNDFRENMSNLIKLDENDYFIGIKCKIPYTHNDEE